MKVFVTGATGFVGREVTDRLLKANHSVRILTRNNDFLSEKLETVIGDTTTPESLQDKLIGCDAVINLVGIIREIPHRQVTFERLHRASTNNLLQAATAQNVPRFIQMSANGARPDAVSSYHKTKWAAEELVRNSGLNWTIFRPSLIFGPRDQFVNMLASLVKLLPIVPVMGDGRYRMQPVSVSDVAASLVAALDNQASFSQSYHCAGKNAYSYNEILDLIGQALGKSLVRKLHQPLWLMRPVVKTMQSIPQFPISADQLTMLLEGNCCDQTAWQTTFDLQLKDFSEGIKEYL